MKIFVTSDTHFNHDNIIKYCNRPFHDVQEMNRAIVNNWNDVVGKQDIVYHLGDFIMGDRKETDYYLNKLNGIKYLVQGNHDNALTVMADGWAKVLNYGELKIGKTLFVLCHYPFESWNRKEHNSVHLHGHCHGLLKTIVPNRFDVGMDCTQFTPVNIEHYLPRIIIGNPGDDERVKAIFDRNK
jgi:calcineurin-like phosphoesterase family protein